jgi:isopentenyl-diphosphate Delta-isomerase
MEKDTCILVDTDDNIQGSASKADAHKFKSGQPTGLLHRAFSVFLFDSQKRLLLQRRADSKITFPGVWTNTCCSHQLHGYDPTEVRLRLQTN